VPPGTVHAILKGTVLLEIQQTSDLTYRLYDYDRVDPITGKNRDLHLQRAYEVLDFKSNNNS
jgi:mannose-6-phosphate isomerase